MRAHSWCVAAQTTPTAGIGSHAIPIISALPVKCRSLREPRHHGLIMVSEASPAHSGAASAGAPTGMARPLVTRLKISETPQVEPVLSRD